MRRPTTIAAPAAVTCVAAFLAAFLPASLSRADGPALDEWKLTRQEDFRFAAKPTVSRDGDHITVTFQAASLCDATVAIEDGEGNIVRHLASGVLGPDAPPPFQAGTPRQRIAWDSKDDRGRYVDSVNGLRVRVSLGLRPRYEQSLNEAPMKLPGHRAEPPRVAAGPQGVLYFAHHAVSFLRLLDHAGDYRRTIYPFPADTVGQVRGLLSREFPQTGKRYPVKWGLNQNTFLTSGDLDAGKGWPESASGNPATTIAVSPTGRIALAHQRVGRLHVDGTTGGMDIVGPRVSFDIAMGRVHSFAGGTYQAHPRSAAFSPDGKTLYLAGYFYSNPWRLNVLHGVAKVDFEADRDTRAEVFAGQMTKNGAGRGDDRFNFPAAVATDAEGRVYVADYVNDRIQVFTPQAKLLKSIPATKPVDLAVHHETGEIYVFSWWFRGDHLVEVEEQLKKQHKSLRIKPRLTRLGPLEDPKVRASYDLPLPIADHGEFGHPGEEVNVAVDTWADPPRFWLVGKENWRGGEPEKNLPRVFVERDGKLEPVREFVEQVKRRVGRVLAPRHGRSRVFANPADGRLYVGESHTVNAKSFDDLVQIDPETRRTRFVQLPFHSEDLAIDIAGQLYLRTENMLARYAFNGGTLREIPFDYGIEKAGVGYSPHSSGRFAKLVAGVDLPSRKPGYWIMGGLAVSPRGDIAIACHNPVSDPSRRGEQVVGEVSKYAPKMYPGRPDGWEIHVLDKHGRMHQDDAVPGSRQIFGMGIDVDRNIYAMTPARRMLPDGTPYPNDVSCTVFKAKAGAAKFVTAGKVPVPVGKMRPERAADIERGLYAGKAWLEGADWLYGGVGNAAKYIGRAGGGCWCQYAQMTLDLFARTFVPEPDLYSVAVLDKAGNLVCRIGQYGNPDDGVPLRKDTAWPAARGIGGDEVALFNPQHVAAHTDRRLFISDIGNGRIVSVKLEYHATETVAIAEE